MQKNDGISELLLLSGLLCIFGMTLFCMTDSPNALTNIIILFVLFCGLTLILWWRKHITDTYRRQIAKRNNEISEKTIAAYENEKKQLTLENARLAKIIHRDNKLIPAMKIAVEKLAAASPDAGAAALLADLERLSQEREQSVEQYPDELGDAFGTGVLTVDAALSFLSDKARQCALGFAAECEKDAVALLTQGVCDLLDLNTLLCDLGENAIIAAREKDGGKVLVRFALTPTGALSLRVYDNGASFDAKVIAKLGSSPITTHKESGGSGIGLMSACDIMRKYDASFCLDETPAYKGFAKCVSVVWDKLGRLTVLTERRNVKAVCYGRSDIICA